MANPPSSPAATIVNEPQVQVPATGAVSNVAPGSQAQSKMAADLAAMFPNGVIPEGARFNREAELMAQAGRQSSLEAAAATPPGSTINAPLPPQPLNPASPPAAPVAAPQAPAAPAQTPEEKLAAEAKATADAAAAEAQKTTDAAKNAAIEAAKNAGKTRLTEEQKDAAERAMTPQAGTAFKAIRGELSEAKQALVEATRKVQEAHSKEAKMLPEEEAQSLRDRIDSYEKRLAIFDYEQTMEYQTQVANPLQRAETEIFALAQKNAIPADDLKAALNDPNPNSRNDRLAEMSSNFNRLDLNKFDRLIGAMDDFKSLGDQLKGEAAARLATYGDIQKQEQAKVQAQMKANWDKSLGETLDKLGTAMPIFKPTGDVQFDADMAAAVQGVQEMDLNTLSNDQIADLFYKGSAFNVVLGLITQLHNKNVALDERIRQLSGTAAPAGGGQPAPSEQPASPVFNSMLDAVRTLPAQIQ